MNGYLGRIEEVKHFVSTRSEWVREDGLRNTAWGEVYRQLVPLTIRLSYPYAGHETRKREAKRELRRRAGLRKGSDAS